ncbi:MAG TPA: aspartate 1-decarboxylase [Brevundimonas sp.]|jgi:aspartate 1-decarboxylase|uniref:aspartate 1-decarboxylase n=1 Tax=Brevundimonas sp. TaxID=1871086 RepID=UPI002B68CF5E|nr:aspartate 1-decarboxylase [Brevundimonas sp.]HRH20242.1 aspartate 1-decarboxylase [Brevundimonas sp.]
MSKIRVLRAKLHGMTVTGADLHYQGSITLDPLLCQQAGIYPMEFVEIWNKNSGARIETYVIHGEPGSGCCVLNGAAARTCQKGDEVIIAASTFVEPGDLYQLKPKVLVFGPGNVVRQKITYEVGQTPELDFEFRMRDTDTGERLTPGM